MLMVLGEFVRRWLRSLGELLLRVVEEDNPGVLYSLDE